MAKADTQNLWTSLEAASATGGKMLADWSASGLSSDSRAISGGELFVALRGPNFDGHDFVADALKRGAVAAMVDHMPTGLADGAPLLVVDDTMDALEDLGRYARHRTNARIVAVTGSVGKTGTKELLRMAFASSGRTYASASSHNNHWGVPLSLAGMAADTEYGIFEIGMNHPGEITPLTRQVQPDIAIITTVAPVHLGHFDSVEEIADAKAEIFDGMAAGGTAILNRDNEYHARLQEAAKAAGMTTILGFGTDEKSDARLLDVQGDGGGSVVSARILGRKITYRLGVPGRHIAMNSLAVLLAVSAAEANLDSATAALGRALPVAGRGQRVSISLAADRPPLLLIDESYNASPIAMEAALGVLSQAVPGENGRRIAVLGDMLELGHEAGRFHAELAEPICRYGVDLTFCCGREMEKLHAELSRRGHNGKACVHAPDSDALVSLVQKHIRPGDVVLVKGSLGSRMAVIVDALKAMDVNKPEDCRHAV